LNRHERWISVAAVSLLIACGSKRGDPDASVTFTTFQNASVVIGQADFTGAAVNQGGTAPAANTLGSPGGNALVSEGKLYLPDAGNRRLLVYNSVPTTNGAPADMVFGQPDFTTVDVDPNNAKNLGDPRSVVAESGKLLIADHFYDRVVVFNAIPEVSGAAADLSVGTSDVTLSVGGFCDANSLYRTSGLSAVNGKILVTDTLQHRVMIWDSIPTASGAPADLVLGQADFTHCGINGGRGEGSTGADTLYFPTDVWSDGKRLVVVDTGNNRVLIWNTFPTTSGTPADMVLGQADFAGTAAGSTQAGLSRPLAVFSNGNQLFVADSDNNRVLVWDSFPTANGAGADVVLGQGDFTHVTANDEDHDGLGDDPSARTLYHPQGVALFGKQLFVADRGNNRYLIYDGK
jgi:hypothetical protein